ECGFASNPDDVRRLNDNQALNNLAKNISAGIIAYLDDK
ncbi:MAG: N-acetylmuramoyl-L-alanine amidase, partial [Clostridiales bacterium]|nr:N-acetylmuramoyl-L-alanine amidase [Clostridiales bacterium]